MPGIPVLSGALALGLFAFALRLFFNSPSVEEALPYLKQKI